MFADLVDDESQKLSWGKWRTVPEMKPKMVVNGGFAHGAVATAAVHKRSMFLFAIAEDQQQVVFTAGPVKLTG